MTTLAKVVDGMAENDPPKTSQKGAALNFRVPASFKRKFKVTAAQHDITQSQLLREAFALWLEHNGDQA